jgi:triphosphoribosyl-dephospho-CoA synthase
MSDNEPDNVSKPERNCLATVRSMPARHDEIAAALELALLLEVSAHPKPGNVHRTRDFESTRFEHFLSSAAALEPHFRQAALRGSKLARGSIHGGELMIGEQIKRAVESSSEWQHGGNTSLGAILLLIPISCAAGMVPSREALRAQEIRKNLRRITRDTTKADAVNVYRAISHASPGGLGEVPELDVNDRDSLAEIQKRNLSLLDVFRISSGYDTISSEWVKGYPVTFDIGLRFLVRELRATGDINTAVVDTYLRILSQVPDTLVARKLGAGRAEEVSLMAKQVLKEGGMKTLNGRVAVRMMDKSLQRIDHRCNPGTTADLTASALSILVLNGYRP